ncbi:alpha/beta hydrolase family protein [Dyella caseinilytica]|uniref:Alpha/beta fold hydrolase n=1 Tax=Dyella caseinilytica TaxID=1849581 RepID=A0ABX7GRF3_9GAMM|nr:alpha/beta fold hydrolase [Dyella caseinilytica]QRN52509.1 alpha/beta fold hydrolase [Dyella caseinilytica]GGA06639.1 dipeptidyl aminopeptidase [Dyella caseinilytica]
MRNRFFAVAIILIIAAFIWHFLDRPPEDLGNPRYFTDQTYNFETSRALNDIAIVGGDAGEVGQAVAGLKAGDAQGWYDRWMAAGDRAMALAHRTADPTSKGHALLRAHNYYRSAEFFLPPNDARRPEAWKKNVDAFYQGLDVLGVKYERIKVPYGTYHLNAVYYPGAAGSESKPLLVVVGGYDGTMEEMYFHIVAAALQRGYPVLTYEGPGQGSVLREQGLTFTPQWEKPNGAVLDTFLASHPTSGNIVLIGESMGGYLAPRAAAFDPRISGVVAYDVFFDGGAIASRNVPPFVFWLRKHGYNSVLNMLAKQGPSDPGALWSVQNGMWVFGAKGPFEVLDAFKAYTLAPVASRIKADVLILSGADDHFVPAGQADAFQKSLTGARSVTSVVFDRISGGSEHCQIGASSLWHATLFDWLATKFGQPAAIQAISSK